MIQTISFTAMAEWIVGSFGAGVVAGIAITAYLFIRASRKKSSKD